MKSELMTIAMCIVGLTAFAVGVPNYHSAKPSEPQLYTVHFDGIDYQDLEQIRSTNYGSIYRTRAGKRIVFRGPFYEVEQ